MRNVNAASCYTTSRRTQIYYYNIIKQNEHVVNLQGKPLKMTINPHPQCNRILPSKPIIKLPEMIN